MTASGSSVQVSATGGGGGGSYTQIAQVVTSSGATAINFTSIPGTYTSLELKCSANTTDGSPAQLDMNFNGDTSGDYSYGAIYGGDVGGNISSNSATASFAGGVGGGFSTSTLYQADLSINSYANTSFFKSYNGLWMRPNGSGPSNYLSGTDSGTWASTAAITSIALSSSGGGAFLTGSTCTLYGLQ